MSGTIVTYLQNNKEEKYLLSTEESKRSIDSIATNFLQEMVTRKGSNLFDKSYGTMFIDNLGSQVNVYKIDYFLKQEVSGMKEKYGITSVSATKAWVDADSGYLNVSITVEFEEMAVSSFVDFRFDGSFTDGDIIEYA